MRYTNSKKHCFLFGDCTLSVEYNCCHGLSVCEVEGDVNVVMKMMVTSIMLVPDAAAV